MYVCQIFGIYIPVGGHICFGTYLAISCEAEVAVGCMLAHTGGSCLSHTAGKPDSHLTQIFVAKFLCIIKLIIIIG